MYFYDSKPIGWCNTDIFFTTMHLQPSPPSHTSQFKSAVWLDLNLFAITNQTIKHMNVQALTRLLYFMLDSFQSVLLVFPIKAFHARLLFHIPTSNCRNTGITFARSALILICFDSSHVSHPILTLSSSNHFFPDTNYKTIFAGIQAKSILYVHLPLIKPNNMDISHHWAVFHINIYIYQ